MMSEETTVDKNLFASTLKSLVQPGSSQQDEPKKSSEVPVLSKRKPKELKELEKEKKRQRKLRLAREEKKRIQEQGKVQPELANISFERELRKIATRGVVVLFNAIQSHQIKAAKTQDAAKEKAKQPMQDVKDVSKSAFLDLLKSGGKAAAATSETNPEKPKSSAKWNALSDDYMLDAKLGDYDKEDEDEDEEEEEIEEESES